jgi:hypothetical protein
MKSPLSLTLLRSLAFACLVCAALAPSVQAQTAAAAPNDAVRSRISDAIAKGDFAGADKLMSSLQPAKAGAAPQGGSITYEEIKACGFYPQESRLECALDIKQLGGYGGNVGQFGSFEYVYFCVDWDGNQSYSSNEAVGLGIVHMHDESDGKQPNWQYAVYRDIDSPGALNQALWLRTAAGVPAATTSKGSTRNARAILSWNSVPTSCLYSPFWGNTVNFRIRFDPIH